MDYKAGLGRTKLVRLGRRDFVINTVRMSQKLRWFRKKRYVELVKYEELLLIQNYDGFYSGLGA